MSLNQGIELGTAVKNKLLFGQLRNFILHARDFAQPPPGPVCGCNDSNGGSNILVWSLHRSVPLQYRSLWCLKDDLRPEASQWHAPQMPECHWWSQVVSV